MLVKLYSLYCEREKSELIVLEHVGVTISSSARLGPENKIF